MWIIRQGKKSIFGTPRVSESMATETYTAEIFVIFVWRGEIKNPYSFDNIQSKKSSCKSNYSKKNLFDERHISWKILDLE